MIACWYTATRSSYRLISELGRLMRAPRSLGPASLRLRCSWMHALTCVVWAGTHASTTGGKLIAPKSRLWITKKRLWSWWFLIILAHTFALHPQPLPPSQSFSPSLSPLPIMFWICWCHFFCLFCWSTDVLLSVSTTWFKCRGVAYQIDIAPRSKAGSEDCMLNHARSPI